MHFFKTGFSLPIQHAGAVKRPPADAVVNAGINLVHKVQAVNIVRIHQLRCIRQILRCRMIGRRLRFQHTGIQPGRHTVCDFLRVFERAGNQLLFKSRAHIAEDDSCQQYEPHSHNRQHIEQNFGLDGSSAAGYSTFIKHNPYLPASFSAIRFRAKHLNILPAACHLRKKKALPSGKAFTAISLTAPSMIQAPWFLGHIVTAVIVRGSGPAAAADTFVIAGTAAAAIFQRPQFF